MSGVESDVDVARALLLGEELRALAGHLAKLTERLDRWASDLDGAGHVAEASLAYERSAALHHVATTAAEWGNGIAAIERRTGVSA